MGFRSGESGGRSAGGAPKGFGAGAVPLLSLSQSLALAKQEFARARRYGYPLTLGVARVDRLENLSDLYGKEARPMLFEQVARLFQSRSRTTDLLGRLSDERLLWVLPHTELGGARIAADRMRCAVEELELQSGRRSIHVSLSIGLACYFQQNTIFFDSLLMQTEQALERAQNRGGNLVEEHPLAAGSAAAPGEASDGEAADGDASGGTQAGEGGRGEERRSGDDRRGSPS